MTDTSITHIEDEFIYLFQDVDKFFDIYYMRTQIINKLRWAGISLVGDIAILSKDDISLIPGIGPVAFVEIEESFRSKGFEVGQCLPWWPRPVSMVIKSLRGGYENYQKYNC